MIVVKRLTMLIVLLAVFILFLTGKPPISVSEAYDHQCRKTRNLPYSTFFYNDYDCEQGVNVGKGDLLFAHYGEDSQCWEIEDEEEREECYSKTPYGGAGTFHIGGNYVLKNADHVGLGSDGTGYHWIMTTTTEPLGNALGVKAGSDVIFGDNAVVEGSFFADSLSGKDIKIGRNDFYLDINSKEKRFWYEEEGSEETGEYVVEPIKRVDLNGNLDIYGRIYCGSLESCAKEESGDRYMYDASNIDFNSTLRVSDNVYFCDPYYGCDLNKYRSENVWNFHDKYDNTDQEVVKHDCKEENEEDCFPQPYTRYKVFDYEAESNTPGETSGVSGVVACMAEDCTDCEGGVWVEKPEKRDNISCKECGDSENDPPFGCAEE